VDSLLVDEVGDPSLAPGESTARALRLTGVGLVLLVALARPLVWAAGVALGAPRRSRDPIDSEPLLRTLVAMADRVALLALTGYVLWRQGRLRLLGLTARGSDFLLGAALAAVGLLPFALRDRLVYGGVGSWLTGPLTLERITVMELASVAAIAAVTSLVFRAYLITEVRELTDNAPLAIVASIAAEELSRFYISIPAAIQLLVYSLFYWKTRRATPLLVAAVLAALWVLLHHAPGS